MRAELAGESARPTLTHKDFRSGVAGAFACEPIFSQALSELYTDEGLEGNSERTMPTGARIHQAGNHAGRCGMNRFVLLALTAALLPVPASLGSGPVPAFQDLFNGKDLMGWVNVNTN